MNPPVEIEVLGTEYTMVAVAAGRVLARAVRNEFGWHVLLSPSPTHRPRARVRVQAVPA